MESSGTIPARDAQGQGETNLKASERDIAKKEVKEEGLSTLSRLLFCLLNVPAMFIASYMFGAASSI